jgi:hypothetical protein
MSAPKTPSPSPCAEDRANNPPAPPNFAELYGANGSRLNGAAHPRVFIAEHTADAAYWSDLAREAAAMCNDALLAYATRKAGAYARAFAGAVKDMLEIKEGRGR